MPEAVVVQTKPWYKSATVWFNIAAFISGASLLITGFPEGGIPKDVAVTITAYATILSSLINLAVRLFLTGSPIAGTPPATNAPVSTPPPAPPVNAPPG